MKKFLLTCFLLAIVIGGFSQDDWRLRGKRFPFPVCYGNDEVHQTYVAPPEAYLNRLKSAGDAKCEIIVTYDAEFEADPDAKAAFQKAVDIWESLLESPVPIHMWAFWDSQERGVLGSCGPGDWYENFEIAPFKDTYYPVAIVEKMMGEEVNGVDNPDIVAVFNSDNENWYFGLDEDTPHNKYNFTSVVLHEICHGLGYTGMADVDDDNTGYFGRDGDSYPGIYDRYLTNWGGDYLIDTALFKNPSAELYQQFTSNLLFFISPIAIEDAGGGNIKPRIFAPSNWDDGSSITHLNEDTYGAGDENSLMTPNFARGETNHNPGPIALGQLFEMGWKFTRIQHDDHPDVEELADLHTLEIFVNSDYGLDTTKLEIVTSTDGFVTADSTQLTETETPGKWTYDLPLTELGTIEYYITSYDKRNRTFTFPGIAPENVFSVTYGPDNTAPSVSHTPITFMRDNNLSADLLVRTRDNIGIKSVKVEYFANENNPVEMNLGLDSGDLYKGLLEFEAGSLGNGDSVQYRIIIEDTSVAGNIRLDPAEGYYKFYIDGTLEAVSEYTNDFNTDSDHFITSDFSIDTPDNFDDGTFNTIHPYESTGEDDNYNQYEAILKYPIIIKNGGIIEYDEVVLVEPGDAGTSFGDDKFWDYVIVEGSIDEGETWLPLIDGYDSGDNETWETAYNENVSSNNSQTAGTKDLFVNRRFPINGKGHFNVGDQILIKFRMQSDAGAHGWGWCIDNLKIQDPETAIEDFVFSPGEVSFFPNPTTDRLVFKGSFKELVGELKVTLYNNSGQAIRQKLLQVNGMNVQETIEMSGLQAGLYFVTMQFDNGQTLSRKIVKK